MTLSARERLRATPEDLTVAHHVGVQQTVLGLAYGYRSSKQPISFSAVYNGHNRPELAERGALEEILFPPGRPSRLYPSLAAALGLVELSRTLAADLDALARLKGQRRNSCAERLYATTGIFAAPSQPPSTRAARIHPASRCG